MIIKTLDATTKKPLQNGLDIQLLVKGANSGYITVKTTNGTITLDEKLKGQQVTASTNGQGPWTTVTEGATLLVDTKQRQSAGGSSTKGGAGSSGSKSREETSR
jgi:hypothetical protein